ncbi:MAG: 16S rRNA (cytosine(967)-C(5))-methyltransferase RsmB [Candidatus Rokubacteria bacterium]|nr:16S rRNA (cytosine(967)-C(5))-methyltransferase RsmB [Candidatus Rokubacteria bacterium]
MKPAAPARVVAARVLERVERDRAYADVALEHELARRRLPERDAALATEIVLGTLRWQRYLDWILVPHSRRAIEAVDPHARVVLRLTAYQLRFLERIPAFAAVSDAVTLVRQRDKPGVDGFVNAVLRSFTRHRVERALPADRVEALALRLSHPSWIAARWIHRYGAEAGEALMRAMNERPPLTVRANTLRTTREALAERLRRDHGLVAKPTRYAADGLQVSHGGAPSSWRAFADGELAVQDEASMLVSMLVAARPGETVADACAAPGTKTTHLGQLMENRGRLLAFDREPARLARVREAVTRLGVTIVETLDGPVESRAPDFAGLCDAVLVDAPCSNLGVLRRNPEVKWRRTPEDLPANAERQRVILSAAAQMVKAGGRLVYATCSLEPEENDDVARAFRETHAEFAVDRLADVPVPIDDGGFLRCLPYVHGTDGFTAIRFRRRPGAV